MSKSTSRSNGRRSIKGLIPVANTRRHRELISPNRGNKRGTVGFPAGRSSVRVVRWISRNLTEALDGALPPGVERVLRPCQRKRPPFVRLVDRQGMRNWYGDCERGSSWHEGGCGSVGPTDRRTVSWFRILSLRSPKRIVFSSSFSPLLHCSPQLLMANAVNFENSEHPRECWRRKCQVLNAHELSLLTELKVRLKNNVCIYKWKELFLERILKTSTFNRNFLLMFLDEVAIFFSFPQS